MMKIAEAFMDEREKIAVATSDELDRTVHTVLTREDTRRQVQSLFANATEAQKRDKAVVDRLFVQAPAAQTRSPLLQKTASATEAFFEGQGSIYDRYPELAGLRRG